MYTTPTCLASNLVYYLKIKKCKLVSTLQDYFQYTSQSFNPTCITKKTIKLKTKTLLEK